MRIPNNNEYTCSNCGTAIYMGQKICLLCDEPLDDEVKKSFWDRLRGK